MKDSIPEKYDVLLWGYGIVGTSVGVSPALLAYERQIDRCMRAKEVMGEGWSMFSTWRTSFLATQRAVSCCNSRRRSLRCRDERHDATRVGACERPTTSRALTPDEIAGYRYLGRNRIAGPPVSLLTATLTDCCPKPDCQAVVWMRSLSPFEELRERTPRRFGQGQDHTPACWH